MALAPINGNAVPRPAIVFFEAPDVLPRDGDAMRIRPNGRGVTDPFLDLRWRPLAARQVTPGMLVECLYNARDEWVVVEPLQVRPQDFNLVMSWLPTPPYGQAEMEAYVNDAAHHGASMTDHVILPAFVSDGRTRANLVVGVPLDAPDFDRFQGRGEIVFTVTGTRILPWDGRLYNGIGYKWWVLPFVTVDVPGAGFMSPSDYFSVFLPY